MPKVLIPTNDRGFVRDLAEAYCRAGCEVVVGRDNFFLSAANYDIVHLQWPEEFSDWKVPDEETFATIRACLLRWSQNTRIMLSVHNLYPHGYEGNEHYRKLYSTFFEIAHLITYFSSRARDIVLQEYGAVADKASVVHGLFNYVRLLEGRGDKSAARHEFGLAERDFVVLVFGAIRSWREVCLIKQAMDLCRAKNGRLLMAGRYVESGPLWRQRFRRMSWQAWLKARNSVVVNGYVPDDEVHKVVDAADVVLVPRIDDLSSGLVPLAMTFGKIVVAPDHGAFPDYLKGTENPLYKSGDAVQLARALELAHSLDSGKVGALNAELARGWTWDGIVTQCLSSLKTVP